MVNFGDIYGRLFMWEGDKKGSFSNVIVTLLIYIVNYS